MEWIKIEDKMPEEGKQVLVIVKRIVAGFIYQEVGYHKQKKWWNDLIGELEHSGFGDDTLKSHIGWNYQPSL